MGVNFCLTGEVRGERGSTPDPARDSAVVRERGCPAMGRSPYLVRWWRRSRLLDYLCTSDTYGVA